LAAPQTPSIKENNMKGHVTAKRFATLMTLLFALLIAGWVTDVETLQPAQAALMQAKASPLLTDVIKAESGRESFAKMVTGENNPLVGMEIATVYVPKSGDTMSGLFGRKHLSVALLNGIDNPDRIYAGRALFVPVGVNVRQPKAKVVSQHVVRRATVDPDTAVVDCSTRKGGECVIAAFGRDPYNRSGGNPIEYLKNRGCSEQAAQELVEHYQTGACELGSVPHNKRFTTMASGRGALLGVRYAGHSTGYGALAWYCRASTGEGIIVPETCGNFAEDVEFNCNPRPEEVEKAVEPQPPPETPAEPAVAPEVAAMMPPPPEQPAEVSEEVPTQQVPDAVVAKPKEPCCNQVDAYIGAGKVWHQDSHYGYIGFDWYYKCWVLIDKDGGVHKLGFGADYALGSGHAGTDGTFKWDMLKLRPVAYKYEGTDGKTLRIRGAIARLRDGVTADQARFDNSRQMWFWGPDVIFTDQGRKDEGEKWFSEYRLSASALFAFDKNGSQSWQGNEITDTAELLKLNGMVSVGTRLYIRDFDNGKRIFVQAGLSAQWPNVSRNLGLSVGLDGEDELWTVWTGPSFDLKQDSWSGVAEVSLNLGNMYLHRQGLARQLGIEMAVECVEGEGYAYYPEKGLLLPGACPKDAK
jgi:LysM repeat protein